MSLQKECLRSNTASLWPTLGTSTILITVEAWRWVMKELRLFYRRRSHNSKEENRFWSNKYRCDLNFLVIFDKIHNFFAPSSVVTGKACVTDVKQTWQKHLLHWLKMDLKHKHVQTLTFLNNKYINFTNYRISIVLLKVSLLWKFVFHSPNTTGIKLISLDPDIKQHVERSW